MLRSDFTVIFIDLHSGSSCPAAPLGGALNRFVIWLGGHVTLYMVNDNEALWSSGRPSPAAPALDHPNSPTGAANWASVP